MEKYAYSSGDTGHSASSGQITAKGRFSFSEALKIYANVYKGRPPLKPNKGNNGFISWLSGQGSPNSGASDKPVELTFTWTHGPLDFKTKNQELIDLYNLQYGTIMQHNRRTWCAAGQLAESAEGIVELSVPTHSLLNSPSLHKAGTFFLINERNAHRVSLVTDLTRLREKLKDSAVPVEQWEVSHRAKDVACAGPDHPAFVIVPLAGVTETDLKLRLIEVKNICIRNRLSLSYGVHVDDFVQEWIGQITCKCYTQLKHAGREFAQLSGVQFFPPNSWPPTWQNVQRFGSGGRNFNPKLNGNTCFASQFENLFSNYDWTD